MMARQLRAVALVALVSTGCVTHRGSESVAKAGGYMLLTGVAVAAAGGLVIHSGGGEGMVYLGFGVAVAGAIVAVPGAVVGASGLVGMHLYDEADDPIDDPAADRSSSSPTPAKHDEPLEPPTSMEPQ